MVWRVWGGAFQLSKLICAMQMGFCHVIACLVLINQPNLSLEKPLTKIRSFYIKLKFYTSFYK